MILMKQERTITKTGTEIAYNYSGNGNTIILIHGFLETKEIWDEFEDLLAKQFSVISIDLPGHGKSGLQEKQYSISDYAQTVKDVMDFEQIKKATLIGHSMGGYVALAFADEFHENLSGLCLFHSTPLADSEEKKTMRELTIEKIRNQGTEQVCKEHAPKVFANENIAKFEDKIQKNIETALGISAQGVINSLYAMKNRKDYSQIFQDIEVPVCYIIGTKDNFIGLDILRNLKFPQNNKTKILNNSGHIGFIEEKELALSIITDFSIHYYSH